MLGHLLTESYLQKKQCTTLVEDYFFPLLPATNPMKLANFDASWYIRRNPEDRINRKPDDRKKLPKNQKYKKWNTENIVLYLIFGPIYIYVICWINAPDEQVKVFIWSSSTVTVTKWDICQIQHNCQINAPGEQVGVFIWSSSMVTVTKRDISSVS